MCDCVFSFIGGGFSRIMDLHHCDYFPKRLNIVTYLWMPHVRYQLIVYYIQKGKSKIPYPWGVFMEDMDGWLSGPLISTPIRTTNSRY